jgi:hypothetical protein
MDPGSLPPNLRPPGAPAPSLAELRTQIEAAVRAYPELRCELRAALAGVRRALGERVPTRAERRGPRQ